MGHLKALHPCTCPLQVGLQLLAAAATTATRLAAAATAAEAAVLTPAFIWGVRVCC